ncbi:putative mitochondrial protein AtMg00310 [Silene latifolia]|uniref:putative mitochondrial protein AtMg00310 n=1 Tax=Silene latifolia TaxID=37657 RepID=UPI003D76B840
MVHFWWSGTRTNKSIHWCSKEFLSRPVGEGGLGFRNIGCFNQALLAKSAWRILCIPGSLISKVIGPKLGVQDDILFKNRWKAPQASSWALKSLVWGSDLIYNNIAWTIGSSSRLNAWKSKWIEGYSLNDLCGDFIDATSDSTLLVGDLHDNHRR